MEARIELCQRVHIARSKSRRGFGNQQVVFTVTPTRVVESTLRVLIKSRTCWRALAPAVLQVQNSPGTGHVSLFAAYLAPAPPENVEEAAAVARENSAALPSFAFQPRPGVLPPPAGLAAVCPASSTVPCGGNPLGPLPLLGCRGSVSLCSSSVRGGGSGGNVGLVTSSASSVWVLMVFLDGCFLGPPSLEAELTPEKVGIPNSIESLAPTLSRRPPPASG